MTPIPRQIEDVLALSPLQEGLFALARLAEDGIDLYSMQFVVDIDGPVDLELLRRSAQVMLDRHPNLRAAFWDRDVPQPVQIVPTQAALPWSERASSPTEFDDIARSERRRPFDLSQGPALRVVLLTVPGETRRRMIFTAHHILVDGWSLAVFFVEMLAIYQAEGSADGLPTPRPYRDYIAWLAQQDRTAAIAQWADYLRGVSEPLMVADRTIAAGDGVPERTELRLPAADAARLRKWASCNGFTLNTSVLFAWAVVLSRLADRRDVVFGTVISGRPERLPGVDTMVGLFINAVPVVHHVSGVDPVIQQCARLQRESSAMRDVGFLSLSDIQRECGRGTLFDCLFVFENAPIEDAIREVDTADGVHFSPVEMESLTHYPLTVVSHMLDDELVVLVEAISEALQHFSPVDIGERLLSVLRQLPDIGDGNADALDVLTTAERAEFERLAKRSLPTVERTSVWEMFERQVRVSPDAVALTAGGSERYTYAQLHAEVSRLAAELAEQGVGPEQVVALVLPRSSRAIVAIFAVLAAGGTYLPIDVTLPTNRMESILRQANPVLAVTQRSSCELTGTQLPRLILDDSAVAERISRRRAAAPAVRRYRAHSAYVIFTSGSTGEPKGVVGTNAALLGYFADHRERIYRAAWERLGRPMRIAHSWSLSFDASWQPMVGLLDGHAVHLFDSEEMRDADRMVKGIATQQIDMIDTTPSMFVQLRAAGLLDHGLSVLALGGEAINPTLWEQFHDLSEIAVYNCYGPTEVTVEATVAGVKQYQIPTIGTPNAGTFAYVLDSELRIVPDGVVGELYLSGIQQARGYVGRSAMTAVRFVADPFRPGHRMYRTGDLARRLASGGLSYVGRSDTQIKIRGYRVETAEVEAALRVQPGVHDAAVSVVHQDGATSLVGFVVWQPNRSSDLARLRLALTNRLPSYMVPARIVVVPELPVNANGKLDTHAIGQLAADALARVLEDGMGSASTETERMLCETFGDQLNGQVPHIDDDLFSIGIDSIVAISLALKARRRGLTLSPRMLVTAPTIRQLAAMIDAGAETAVVSAEYGEVLPLPMVCWLYEYGNYRRFTHTVLLQLPSDIDRSSIESMLQLLLDGHDTLRSVLAETPNGPRLVTRPPGTVAAATLLTRVEMPRSTDAEWRSAITHSAREVMDEIDPRAGQMVRAVWLSDSDQEQVLLLTAHHLAVDVISWHIILGEVAEAWRALRSGEAPEVLPEFTSYRRWSELMWQRAATADVAAQREYWIAQVREPDPALGVRHPDPTRDVWSSLRVTPVVTPVPLTERLLATTTRDAGVRAFLLAAMTMTIASWRRERGQNQGSGTLIELEGHGRADAAVGTDTTNTVGWFTSAFPIRLGVGEAAVDVEQAEDDSDAAQRLLGSVATQLAATPNEGLDYGLLRYVERTPELREATEPQIQLNYMGRMDLAGVTRQPWSLLTGPEKDALPIDPEPDLPLHFALIIGVLVDATPEGTQLVTNWCWSGNLFARQDIDRLANLWQRSIEVLAAR
ncbi:non-ribosomal peptide synthetase [Mycobacterium sp.]|uniref:non-ribosomal peptide synthetase n=1 Tax=Mycobacterium sp. TaxID=1785 RepID=UPI0025E80512|nr:non-ribosomal peptide synthetase [Mycobacterium sp.]